MAIVTVIVTPGSEPDARRAIASLQQQSLTDWEAVLVTNADEVAHAADLDGRVLLVRAVGAWEGVNAVLEECESEFVMLLPGGGALRATALRDLVEEARGGRAGAVFGGFRYTAAMGELPGDPCAGMAAQVGAQQWGRSRVVPLAAQLFRRDVIGEERLDAEAGSAADWEWCRRLAGAGVRWRRCAQTVADIEVGPTASARVILESVRQHRRVKSRMAVIAGGAKGTEREGGDDGCRFAEAERGIERLIAFNADRAARMTAGMEMPWRFGQWWHRLGFVGAGPAHLLEGRSRPAPEELAEVSARPPVDIVVASYKRPDRLAALIESVRATGYPARVLVGAGDVETVRVCERFPEFVECVYSTAANRLTGCTAPLNLVAQSLVRNDMIFCTDDCVFAPDALEVAVRSLYSAYPDSDGVVGLAQENIPGGYELAFPLIGRKFRERFTSPRGRCFFPGYWHMYNDGELGLTIEALGNWHFEGRARLRRFHAGTGAAEDATHTVARCDAEIWHERRMRGVLWGIDR